jgi:hypothetical protein
MSGVPVWRELHRYAVCGLPRHFNPRELQALEKNNGIGWGVDGIAVFAGTLSLDYIEGFNGGGGHRWYK